MSTALESVFGSTAIVWEEFPTKLVALAKVANHKLDRYFEDLKNVINYNGTIRAQNVGTYYIVDHWNTRILEFNRETNTIDYLHHSYISQTTSTLIGRILRSLPREAVSFYLGQLSTRSPEDSKRLAKMIR